MSPDGIVLTPPAFDQNFGLLKGVENLSIQELIAQAGVETLDVAVLPGAELAKVPPAKLVESQRRVPGVMYAVCAPTPVIHACTAFAINSGPLSDRICAGTPRRMNKSESTSMT